MGADRPADRPRLDDRKFLSGFGSNGGEGSWELFADSTDCLWTGGDFSRQTARLHAALDAGGGRNPYTLVEFPLVEFARLGLLRDEDYAPFVDNRTVRYRLRAERALGDRGELTIRGLVARGKLTDEQRRLLAQREASGLPAYPDSGALGDWRSGLFALEALGARDLARERARDLPKVIEAHWSGRTGSRPFQASFEDFGAEGYVRCNLDRSKEVKTAPQSLLNVPLESFRF